MRFHSSSTSRRALVTGSLLVPFSLLVSACGSNDAPSAGGGGSAGQCSAGACAGSGGSSNGGHAGSAGRPSASAGASGASETAGSAADGGSAGLAAGTGGSEQAGGSGVAGTGGSLAGGGTGGSLAGGGGAGGSLAGSGGAGGAACTVPTTGTDLSLLLRGSQAIEAEAATLSGSAAAAIVGTGFSGTGFVDLHGSEGGMDWLVNVPADGTYGLTWTYAESEPRDMDLAVNCVAATSPVVFSNTGSWNASWLSDITRSVHLKKGVNRIRLATNGSSGPNFDKLTITPPLCTLSNATPTTCEAEAALLSGVASGSALGTGWTGTGFADMNGGEGGVNWVLKAPAAGNYRITIFYTQDDTRAMTLTVNGVTAVAPLAFGRTHFWNTAWIGDVSVDVALALGENSFQLATNGASGPNFDKIVVTSLPDTGGGGTGGGGGAGGAAAGAGGAAAGTGGAAAGAGGAAAGAGGAAAGAGGAAAGAGGAAAGAGGAAAGAGGSTAGAGGG